MQECQNLCEKISEAGQGIGAFENGRSDDDAQSQHLCRHTCGRRHPHNMAAAATIAAEAGKCAACAGQPPANLQSTETCPGTLAQACPPVSCRSAPSSALAEELPSHKSIPARLREGGREGEAHLL